MNKFLILILMALTVGAANADNRILVFDGTIPSSLPEIQTIEYDEYYNKVIFDKKSRKIYLIHVDCEEATDGHE